MDDTSTSGYIAYLYKGCYYATYIPDNAFPDTLGDWFAAKIPRKEAERKTWMNDLIDQIGQEVAWRHEHNIADDEELEATYEVAVAEENGFVAFNKGRPLLFRAIISGVECKLLPGQKGEAAWTYVIDIDSRAFTINALMHFHLDSMPSGTLNSYFWRIQCPSCDSDCDMSWISTFAHRLTTPYWHIGTTARWPPPDFDVSQAHEKYTRLEPIVLSTEEWGAPSRHSLTVAQQFSVHLVRIILRDNAEAFSNPDIGPRRAFGVRCWQLLSAAAPCHLQLPTQTEDDPRYCYSLSQLKRATSWNCLTPHYDSSSRFDHANLDHRYHWFRGCLIVFCPRLDLPEYIAHETVQMVENLRKYGRTTGIGIAFSGRHILSVAVDGDTVVRSYSQKFHNKTMLCCNGVALAIHLLSPLLATNKTQCLGKPSSNLTATASRARLPRELIQQIVFQLDHDTFQGIHAVSRLFRELSIRYPRIGEYFLLAHVDLKEFRVYDTTTDNTTTVCHQRYHPVHRAKKDLARSFQHVHRGPYNLVRGPDQGSGVLHGHNSEYKVCLSQDSERWEGDGWPQIRLQVVDGTWVFVAPPARRDFPEVLKYDEDRDRHPDSSIYRWHRWQGYDI